MHTDFWSDRRNHGLGTHIEKMINKRIEEARQHLPNYSTTSFVGEAEQCSVARKILSTIRQSVYSTESVKKKIDAALIDKNKECLPTILDIARSPWHFSDKCIGLLYWVLLVSEFDAVNNMAREDERDINPTIFQTAATILKILQDDIDDEAPLPGGRTIRAFYAPTTKVEGDTGADIAIVAHSEKFPDAPFRVALLQGKIAKKKKKTVSVARDSDGGDKLQQLKTLANTGIGFYAFYDHSRFETITGESAFPALIRDAKNVLEEVNQTGSHHVGLFAPNSLPGRPNVPFAQDLATFIAFTMFDPREAPLRKFTSHAEVVRELRQHHDLQGVMAISNTGGPAFEKLKQLSVRDENNAPAFLDKDQIIDSEDSSSQPSSSQAYDQEDEEPSNDSEGFTPQ